MPGRLVWHAPLEGCLKARRVADGGGSSHFRKARQDNALTLWWYHATHTSSEVPSRRIQQTVTAVEGILGVSRAGLCVRWRRLITSPLGALWGPVGPCINLLRVVLPAITGCWNPTRPSTDLAFEYYGPLVASLSALVSFMDDGQQAATLRGKRDGASCQGTWFHLQHYHRTHTPVSMSVLAMQKSMSVFLSTNL